MRPEIQRLVELQALDARLADWRTRLAALPAQLSAIEKAVAEARQQITAAKEALTTSLKDRKKYEMDVDSWKEKARKYREQSFEVKTNEAYKALQHEAQHAEGQVAEAEDRLLERMVAGEDFERQVKAAERALVSVEAAGQADRQKIEAEQATLQADCNARQAERDEAAASVPEDLFTTYTQVAERRHGIGVAEVRDEACGLCGVRIRPHVFQELRRADCQEIFQCETCNRILYYAEPPAAAAASAEATPGAARVSANK
jgi:predicted  nucleic acid-binding Zn-ribbon protein